MKPTRRDLLEMYIKKCWEDGFDVDAKIKLSFNPTDGFGRRIELEPPPLVLVNTDYGKIIESLDLKS